jgi:tRNA (guanine-N7-)-methyltransferase
MSDKPLLPWEEAELRRGVPLVMPTVLPPVDWTTVGGRPRPLELELGYGRPHFLLERAAEVPEHLVVGVEWKARWAHAARKRARRQGLDNVVPLAANAWHVVGGLFPPGSLSAIWLNFPDPWWKARHEKRRIVNDAFAHLLSERLAPGGTLLVQTDVASLLEQFLEVLEADPLLDNPHGAGRLCPRKPTAARSHREKRCVADGVPCFRGLLCRR